MIRKLLTIVEETHREAGQEIRPPTRKAAAIAVIANPFAGRHAGSLDELVELGEMLGALLGERAVRALGIAPGQAESYGKAAIVGEDGELEHAAAILHPKLGAPLRVAVEHGAAAWGRRSTCRWATRTPPSCAAISTPWKSACPTRRAATRSWWPWW